MIKKYVTCCLLLLGACTTTCTPIGEPSISRQKEDASGQKFTPFAFAPGALPPFLTGQKPLVNAQANQTGQIGTLYANNNNTLIAVSENSPAIASLSSSSLYSVQPLDNVDSDSNLYPDGSTDSYINALAGYAIMAQEQTQAFAFGDDITFINHGGSQVSGLANSGAQAETVNEASVPGSGWKSN